MERCYFDYVATIQDANGGTSKKRGTVEVQYSDLVEAEGKVRELAISKYGPRIIDFHIKQVKV